MTSWFFCVLRLDIIFWSKTSGLLDRPFIKILLPRPLGLLKVSLQVLFKSWHWPWCLYWTNIEYSIFFLRNFLSNVGGFWLRCPQVIEDLGTFCVLISHVWCQCKFHSGTADSDMLILVCWFYCAPLNHFRLSTTSDMNPIDGKNRSTEEKCSICRRARHVPQLYIDVYWIEAKKTKILILTHKDLHVKDKHVFIKSCV